VGGTSTNITNITQNTSLVSGGNIYLAEMFPLQNRLPSLTAALQRFAVTATISTASTAYVSPYIQFNFPVSSAIDITLRIAAPQLEQGRFATSFIPTSGSGATRAEDVLTVPAGSWLTQNIGTLYSAATLPFLGSIQHRSAVSLDDGTANNAVHSTIADQSSDAGRTEIITGGVSQFGADSIVYVPETLWRHAAAYRFNEAAAAMNGTVFAHDNTVSLSSFSVFRVGAGRGNTGILGGHVQKVRYYPSFGSDAQLQALTQ
jgi:hypothetical protein